MIGRAALVDQLERDSWQIREDGPWLYACKRIAGRAIAGSFSPDGGRVVTLRHDPCGALERLGGWGDTERRVSLFRASDAAAAIADALTP